MAVIAGTFSLDETSSADQIVNTITTSSRTKVSSIWIDGVNTTRGVTAKLFVDLTGGTPTHVGDFDGVMGRGNAINVLMTGAIEVDTDLVLKMSCNGLGTTSQNVYYRMLYDTTTAAVESVFKGEGDAADVDLSMRSIAVNNDTGPALELNATGAEHRGVEISSGSSEGVYINGGGGSGLDIHTGDSGSNAITLDATAGRWGLYVAGDDGGAIFNGAVVGSGPAIQLIGGSGYNAVDILAVGGGNGIAMTVSDGGNGLAISVSGGDGVGISVSGNGIAIDSTLDGVKIETGTSGNGIEIDSGVTAVKLTGTGEYAIDTSASNESLDNQIKSEIASSVSLDLGIVSANLVSISGTKLSNAILSLKGINITNPDSEVAVTISASGAPSFGDGALNIKGSGSGIKVNATGRHAMWLDGNSDGAGIYVETDSNSYNAVYFQSDNTNAMELQSNGTDKNALLLKATGSASSALNLEVTSGVSGPALAIKNATGLAISTSGSSRSLDNQLLGEIASSVSPAIPGGGNYQPFL